MIFIPEFLERDSGATPDKYEAYRRYEHNTS